MNQTGYVKKTREPPPPAISNFLPLLGEPGHSTPWRISVSFRSFRLKGQCREILSSGFFHETTFPSPVDMSRKDFEFFRLFEELLVFLINFLVYSPPWSRDSQVYSSPESCDYLVMNTPGSRPKLVYKKNLLLQNTPGSQDSPVINKTYTGESLLPSLFVTRKFCCKPVLMPVPNTPRS
jgi:hypothetical protein